MKALIEVFNNRILPNTIYVKCPRPLDRGVRRIGVRYKGKYRTLISRPDLVSAELEVRLAGGPLNRGSIVEGLKIIVFC